MAEASISINQLMCSVCLDLLSDPVTVPCGHSYCMSCITDCWDRTSVYSCPHCRRVFNPRPVLGKNIILSEMIENLRRIQPQDDFSSAGCGDVCDKCIGIKHKAVTSCLVCLQSYCDVHFKHHEKIYSGEAHEVTDATRLQENVCRQHNKRLEVFCRTDQKVICSLCTRDEHRNHETVTAVAETTEKQKQIKIMQRNIQNYLLFKEGHLQKLRENLNAHKWSAKTEGFAKRRAEQLEKEIEALKNRDAELDELLKMHDHIQFLQRFQSFSGLDIPIEMPDFTSIMSTEDMRKLLKGLELKSKAVPRPRPSSVAFQPSAHTPTTSNPQIWPPTPPKPRPRPSSIAPEVSPSPKSWAKSITPSETQSWLNMESVFHSYGLKAPKSTFETVTAAYEPKRKPIIVPEESWPETSIVPKLKTLTPRTEIAPESKKRPMMPPEPNSSKAPQSQPRTSTAPESQLRTSGAPKFGNLTSRPEIAPELKRKPLMPPEPKTSTLPMFETATSRTDTGPLHRAMMPPEPQLMTSKVPKSETLASKTNITPKLKDRPLMPPVSKTFKAPESQLGTSVAPKFGTVTSRASIAPEVKRKPLIPPGPMTSKAPESRPRTSTAPESQLRTSVAPKFGTLTSRTDIAPEVKRKPLMPPELKTSREPESQPHTSTVPKFGTVTCRTDIAPELKRKPLMPPEPRTFTAPESQPSTSRVPKFGTVTSRTDITPELKRRPMMPPEPTASTVPESQTGHDLVNELRSILNARKLIVP